MPVIIFLIIILGAGIGVFTFIVIRSVIAPRQIKALANLVAHTRIPQAIRLAKRIIVKEPRNADAHYLLGSAYLADGKPELAIMELKTVNQIGQFDGYCKEIPFRTKIAELYAKFNQPEEALKEYLLLMKLQPGNAEYCLQIGRLFESRNRSDRAIGYYKKALEINPRSADAHFRIGYLMYRAKRPVESRNELDLAVRFQPENAEAHYYLGKLLKDGRDFRAAIASFEKSSREPRLKTKSLLERGVCYLALNESGRAVAELERALTTSAGDSTQETLHARYYLAACYERTRRIEDAVDEWERIYQVNRNFRDVAEKLSRFQELRSDDRIKDYMTASQPEFVALCRSLTAAMGLSVRDAVPQKEGCTVIGVEPQSKWRNARSLPKVVKFLRATEPVDESAVRSFHEEMKHQNATRGVIVAGAGFTGLATEFAQSRPIELFDKDKLLGLLRTTNLSTL